MQQQIIEQLQQFMEQHGDQFPAVAEYLIQCQEKCPVESFFTAKEIMLYKLKGEQPEPLVMQDILALLKKGRVVDAIKIHRSIFRTSLKEAKAVIDELRDKHNLWGVR